MLEQQLSENSANYEAVINHLRQDNSVLNAHVSKLKSQHQKLSHIAENAVREKVTLDQRISKLENLISVYEEKAADDNNTLRDSNTVLEQKLSQINELRKVNSGLEQQCSKLEHQLYKLKAEPRFCVLRLTTRRSSLKLLRIRNRNSPFSTSKSSLKLFRSSVWDLRMSTNRSTV